MDNATKIKELIDDFYRIISGRAEDERDWNSFRDLFFPNASLMSVRLNNGCSSTPTDIDSYIQGLDKFLKDKDFYEYGFNYQINFFRNIAHVYSEYEAKASLESNKPNKCGVNLVQLVNDGSGWKILNMLWQDK